MANVFAKSLLAAVAACVASGVLAKPAFAQDPKELFKEAVQALRLGDKDGALTKFRAVIKADPTNAQAWDLYRETDKDVWEELVLKSDEIGKIAQHLILQARRGRIDLNRDEGVMKALLEQACSKDYGVSAPAMEKLRADHGMFAVPLLVAKLGDADDEQGVVNATMTLQRLGRDATLPLVEALNSANAVARQNICSALNLIRDHRAAPALARLATNDEDPVVRDLAGTALRNLTKDPASAAAALYRQAAAEYIDGTASLGQEPSPVVWSMKDGKLMATDVPPSLYWLELAKKNAQAALSIDPTSPDSRSLVARAYLGQVAAIRSAAAAGDETATAMAESADRLRLMAVAFGPETLRRAFVDSERQTMIRVAAADALGDVENKDSLSGSPLVQGLESGSKSVRYASALALAKASRGDLPMADKIVSVLGEAVTEEYVHQVFVIGDGEALKSAVKEAGGERGGRWQDASNGRDAMATLLGYANADVVVINESLADYRPETLIGLIRKNPRFKNTKILIVGANAEEVTKQFGDKIDGVVQGPVTGAALQEKVAEVIKSLPADPIRARAEAVAIDASAMLSKLASHRVNIGAALGNLAGQLNRADKIAAAAADALGEAAGADQVAAMVASVAGSGSEEVRTATARALGKVFGRLGAIDSEFGALLAVASDAKAPIGLRRALVASLGQARLTPEQVLKVSEALSMPVAAPAAGAAKDEG